MSRIGKKPIQIPAGVEVKAEGRNISVKGPKGELKIEIHPFASLQIKGKDIIIIPLKSKRECGDIWGLTRSLIFNMVEGVTKGYEKRLQIEGVGYKAKIEGNNLILNVGFSHPVQIEQPEGVKYSVEKNIIVISGIDKGQVGQTSAKIRKIKPPEPYKGKGIRYQGEVIKLKPGKKVVASGG